MAIAYHDPEVLVRDEPDRDLTPQRTAHRPGEARPHVLIVDDYEFNRNLLASLCELFDCTCECVKDGAAAVKAVKLRRFDLVLMDVRMPKMDGMQATRAIRKLNSPMSSVPIVAVTTKAEPGDIARYMACGMSDVVAKPIRPSKLYEAMTAKLMPPEPIKRSWQAPTLQ